MKFVGKQAIKASHHKYETKASFLTGMMKNRYIQPALNMNYSSSTHIKKK